MLVTLGNCWSILGAALGVQKTILGMRNPILGMASHDLSNVKTTILGATLGATPGIAANPPERFSFAPEFSERFFKNAYGGKVRLLRALRECKQRSLTVSKNAPTVCSKASPFHLGGWFFGWVAFP